MIKKKQDVYIHQGELWNVMCIILLISIDFANEIVPSKPYWEETMEIKHYFFCLQHKTIHELKKGNEVNLDEYNEILTIIDLYFLCIICLVLGSENSMQIKRTFLE